METCRKINQLFNTLKIYLVKNLFFGTGNYKITAALHAGNSHVEENYDWIDGAAMFEVVPNNSDKAFIGMCNLDVDIKEIKSVQEFFSSFLP